MSLVFLLGGARSGKTALALELAGQAGAPVTVIATAEAGDKEMAERIRRHRAERPSGWLTIEEPVDLEGAIRHAGHETVLVIDCLTLWVSNLLARGDSDEEVEALSAAAARQAASRATLTVAVSNEVGLGVVPASELGRRFRDLLGRVNAGWAGAADQACLVVAGRPLQLDPVASLL